MTQKLSSGLGAVSQTLNTSLKRSVDLPSLKAVPLVRSLALRDGITNA